MRPARVRRRADTIRTSLVVFVTSALAICNTSSIADAFVVPCNTLPLKQTTKIHTFKTLPLQIHTSRGQLTMKRPQSKRARQGSLKPVEEGEAAPNLRRKVRAPRPSMGHVVPKAARSGGTGTGGSKNPTLRPQGKARDAGMNNPSNLKIAGGSARGRRLDSPEVYLRPMMGKVREAVFSTFTSFGLYDEGVNTRHLDIFSGSGSVGLESLSRGASHSTFVDFSRDCCDTVERNAKWCQFDGEDEIRVVCADYLQALRDPTSVGIPPGTTYEIVTLTPPYEEVVYADLIDGVANSPLVTDDTVVMIEYPVELGCFPHVITRKDGGALIGVRNRRYGRTVIAMYVVNPTGRMEVAASRPEEFVDV